MINLEYFNFWKKEILKSDKVLNDLLDFLKIKREELLKGLVYSNNDYEIKIKLKEIDNLIEELIDFECCYNEIKNARNIK